MTKHDEDKRRAVSPGQRTRDLRLGRLFGIELVADYSVVLVFVMIAAHLGLGVLPRWHPEWGAPFVWMLSLGAAVLFLGSVLLHELSHALVARKYGLSVPRITLFVFGGVAQLEKEPPSPKVEFLMAAAGPLVSFLIGAGSMFFGAWATHAFGATSDVELETAFRSAGPLTTLLLWLGPVNLSLALFNLVPGFPLDGGRVLRSIIWAITGDLRRATRTSSMMGQAFAWMLMAAGIAMMFGYSVPWFGRGFGGGLWLVLIGWFLNYAARTSFEQLVIHESLDHVFVRDVMRTRVDAVPADLSLGAVVRDFFLSSDQLEFPVVQNGMILGVLSADDMRRVPRERWEHVSAREAMTPLDHIHVLKPDDPASDALRELVEHETLPVVDHAALVGVARRRDIVKWLVLHKPAA